MTTTNTFPTPVRQNGRIYFLRSSLEAHKRALAGLPPVDFQGIDALVPAPRAATELGVGRRTIGRRVAELEDDRAAEHQSSAA
jgi:hypothetical protein